MSCDVRAAISALMGVRGQHVGVVAHPENSARQAARRGRLAPISLRMNVWLRRQRTESGHRNFFDQGSTMSRSRFPCLESSDRGSRPRSLGSPQPIGRYKPHNSYNQNSIALSWGTGNDGGTTKRLSLASVSFEKRTAIARLLPATPSKRANAAHVQPPSLDRQCAPFRCRRSRARKRRDSRASGLSR